MRSTAVLSESDIELLLIRDQLSTDDLMGLIDHPEWRSFSGGLRSELMARMSAVGICRARHVSEVIKFINGNKENPSDQVNDCR